MQASQLWRHGGACGAYAVRTAMPTCVIWDGTGGLPVEARDATLVRVGAAAGGDPRSLTAPHLWDFLAREDRAHIDRLARDAGARWVEACATLEPLRPYGPLAGDWVSTAFVTVETLHALGLLYALRRLCDRERPGGLQLCGSADTLLARAAAAVGGERGLTVQVRQRPAALRARLQAWPPAYWAGDFVQRWLLPKCHLPRRRAGAAATAHRFVFAGFSPNHFRVLRPLMEAALRRGDGVTAAAVRIHGRTVSDGAADVAGIERVAVDALATAGDLLDAHRLRRRLQQLWNAGAAEAGFAAVFASLDPQLWSLLRAPARQWLLVHTPIGARFLAVWRRLLDALTPDAVVLGSDSCHRSRSLVVAARERGVTTLVMQHGVIAQRALYVPRADYMAAWGPATVRALCPLGVEPERFIVAGAPLPRRATVPSPRLPAAAGVRHILLATNSLQPFLADGQHYVRRVLEALAALPGVRLTVCPHPTGEDAGLYRRLVAPLGTRAAVRPGETATVMRDVDAVLVFNSTVALEALAAGTPAITLVGTELADSTEFCASPLIPYAGDCATLVRLLRDGDALRADCQTRREAGAALLADYLGAEDAEPAQTLLDRLTSLHAPQRLVPAAI